MKSNKTIKRHECVTTRNVSRLVVITKKGISKLVIPTFTGFDIVNIERIIYCEANSNYTKVYLEDGVSVMSSRHIGEYDEILSTHDFFRIHKSHIINIQHVVEYKREDGGSVVMNGKKEVGISRRKKSEFLELFFGI